MLTTDSIPVIKNIKGIYEYCVPSNLTHASGIKVNDPAYRSVEEREWLKKADYSVSKPHFVKSARRKVDVSGGPFLRITDYPTIGRQKALVILVEFEDLKFTSMEDAYDYYNGMLNEEGFTHENGASGSARDFYLSSSCGIFDPEFVVVGPITLPKTAAYYGGDTELLLDPNVWEMVVDTCNAVDDMVDFSQFDANGDGLVDSIYFFYAGFGEADSSRSEAIWPHSAQLLEGWGVELTLDGMVINNYACSNEIRYNTGPNWLPVGIGTFVHEFGHVLGLADHYDTTYKSGRLGVQQWDTMAGASYLNNQNTPLTFSAYERAVLGWLELDNIDARQEGILNINALTSDTPNALRVEVEDTDGMEFFIIENRRKEGWDSYIPAEGVLVWHIDEDMEAWAANNINIDPIRQRIDLVEADKSENSSSYIGDVFPGKSNVSQFDFMAWSGEKVFSFDHVALAQDEAMVVLGETGFEPSVPEVEVSEIHGSSFMLSWESQPDALGYILTVRDAQTSGSELFVDMVFNNPEMVNVTGLSPYTAYIVDLRAVAGGYSSSENAVTVTTGALEFFESSPQNLAVYATGDSQYVALWDTLEGATDYEVTLYQMEYGAPEDYAYGFEDGVERLPEGWSTNSTKMSKPVFGEKSPALKLENDGDFLEISYPGCEISSLSFYQFSQISTNSVKVEAFNSDAEVILDKVISTSSNGNVETVDFPASTEKVILTFMRSSGYMILDDVVASVSRLEGVLCEPYVAVLTDGLTSLKMESLEEDKDYGVVVSGLNATEKSRLSEMIRFVPSTVPSGVATVGSRTDTNEEWFDLSGSKVPASQVTKGLYIVRKGTTARKVMKL